MLIGSLLDVLKDKFVIEMLAALGIDIEPEDISDDLILQIL